MFPFAQVNTFKLLRASSFKSASWFEIVLFKTRVRFRCPKPSTKISQPWLSSDIDRRPFFNTKLNTVYERNSYYGGTCVHSAAWGLFANRLWGKPLAQLGLWLRAVCIPTEMRPEIGDAREPERAKSWIQFHYQNHSSDSGGVNFIDQNNGFYEVIFGQDSDLPDAKEIALPLVEITEFSVHSITGFCVRPSANQLDYWFAYDEGELVRFEFLLIAGAGVAMNGLLTEEQALIVLQEAFQFAEGLISTIEITPPN